MAERPEGPEAPQSGAPSDPEGRPLPPPTAPPTPPAAVPPGAPPAPAPPGAPPLHVPPPYPAPAAWQPPRRRENALGIVGLCCSIAGVALLVVTIGFFWFVSLPLSIAGLVCGLLGRQKADRGEVDGGRGMSQAGFVIGIVGLLLHLLALVVIVLLIGLLLDAANEAEIDNPDRRPRLDRSALPVAAAPAGLLLIRRTFTVAGPSHADREPAGRPAR